MASAAFDSTWDGGAHRQPQSHRAAIAGDDGGAASSIVAAMLLAG